ncbi:MAG TPA: hypothetical protein VFX53_05200, partial [Pedococcus sp.]|nr:hypothetical protein [Pedococcus sp.]
QTKRGAGGLGKPNSLADVYGSGWITAGAGSVVLLWGAAGDPIVELSHLKQPDEEVGPLRLAHDHVAGRTSVVEGADVFSLLSAGPQSAGSIASWIYGEKASEAEVAKIRRKLDRLVAEGLARRVDPGPTKGGAGGGSSGVRFEVVSGPTTLVSEAADEPSGSDRRTTDGFSVSAGRATDAVFSAERPASTDERPTLDLISAGRATDAATDATDAQRPTIAPPSIGGREVVGRRSSAAIDGAQECPRCHQSVERLFTAVLGDWPALCGVCAYPDPSTRPGAEKEEENDETDPY